MDNVNNITKTGYHSCVSCGVCAAVCSEKAISIICNDDGFYVPNIDNRLCTGCGMCTKVCYQYLENKGRSANCFTDKCIYAAWSKNPQIVQHCSSGGIGYELTKYFYNKNYKICGCIFDAPNDDCKHIIAASEEDVEAIKTSKYLQSYTVDAFSQFQKDNNYLVIGTPCQIYGLREYIRLKNWENQFILVDFICHGVPSFDLWKKWKEYTVKKEHLPQVWKSFNFRYKDGKNYRWHKFTFHVKDLKDKEYFLPSKLFTEVWDYCRNKSCYHCLLRQEDCFSDIRIADFWGEKYDKRNDGVSLVIPNTQRGEEVWNEIKSQFTVEICKLSDVMPSQWLPEKEEKREIILSELKGEKTLKEIYNIYIRSAISVRMVRNSKRIISSCLKKILGKTLFNQIKNYVKTKILK